ncbi:Dfp1/Him1, central region-domain-containing protein [Sparassis latifolia]
MATILRNPLAVRPHPHQSASISPYQTTLRRATPATAVKRPRSPEPGGAAHLQSAKRHKAAVQQHTAAREDAKREKERKRIEREEEFKIKYSRAFPTFVFYFDMDTFATDVAAMRHVLERRVTQMGARVDDFFSRDITHLITFQPEESNKENVTQTINPTSLLGSPIRLKGRAKIDVSGTALGNIVQKALAFNIKVWNPAKLENVLERCQGPAGAGTTSKGDLKGMLLSERLHGTTERDPTQRRHDYAYFSKNSCFVLVEDMRQDLATIAASEYPCTKTRDGTIKGPWPILYCHPKARGPFIPFDEREDRRRQKADRAEREREHERARRKARLQRQERLRRTQARLQEQQKQQHDLRRCASMNNLQRRSAYPDPSMEGFIDLDADDTTESANASGYLASGAYIAASGNSVGITSTTGTTSAAAGPLRIRELPSRLKGRLQQQVVTSRRVTMSILSGGKENQMGPPPTLPDRPHVLRKSRSTNTLRLPKREEGTKPGYCESCRVKFTDFIEHINTRRHRKFAVDDSNFVQLDYVLERVKRRTIEEVAEENRLWSSRLNSREGDDGDEDAEMMLPMPDAVMGEDVRWDEWVDGM